MNTKIIKELEKNGLYLKTVYNLSKEFDEELAHDIRLELSSNECTPVEVLEKLIKDDDPTIRLNVIKLKSTSANIIAVALKDTEDANRLQLLKSQFIEENDLIGLFADKSPEVVALARKILKSRL